jgi:hypothetical protein
LKNWGKDEGYCNYTFDEIKREMREVMGKG